MPDLGVSIVRWKCSSLRPYIFPLSEWIPVWGDLALYVFPQVGEVVGVWGGRGVNYRVLSIHTRLVLIGIVNALVVCPLESLLFPYRFQYVTVLYGRY